MRRLVVPFALAVVATAAALPGGAAPTFSLWDGTEPGFITHEVDHDGDGVCDGPAPSITNGRYPACTRADGTTQVPHGHFEYTHEQDDPSSHGGDTLEKDYADRDLTDPDDAPFALEDLYWFTTAELGRVSDAAPLLSSSPQCYWQVDEWRGPRAGDQRLPVTSWNERFWMCASGSSMAGGYWGDQSLGAACYAPNGSRRNTCGGQGSMP